LAEFHTLRGFAGITFFNNRLLTQAAVEQLEATAHEFGETCRVRHNDQCDLFFAVQFDQQAGQFITSGAVQCACWFVGQQQARLIDQRSHDSDTSSFPAGKLARPMIQSFAQTDAFQQSARAVGRGFADLCVRANQRWNENVFQHGALREQMVRLEDKADLTVARVGDLFLVQLPNILAFKEDLPARGPIQRADDIEQGALAGTGGANDGGGFSRVYFEAYAVKHNDRWGVLDGLIGFANIPKL
jgi:hypothetical protein